MGMCSIQHNVPRQARGGQGRANGLAVASSGKRQGSSVRGQGALHARTRRVERVDWGVRRMEEAAVGGFSCEAEIISSLAGLWRVAARRAPCTGRPV